MGHWIPAFAGMTGMWLSASMLNCVTPTRYSSFGDLSILPFHPHPNPPPEGEGIFEGVRSCG